MTWNKSCAYKLSSSSQAFKEKNAVPTFNDYSKSNLTNTYKLFLYKLFFFLIFQKKKTIIL